MKKIKKSKTIVTMFWRNYICMILISLVMIVVPYLICIFASDRINKIEAYSNCSAADIMKDDYSQIDTSRIEAINGSIQVVTEALEVITLCGEGLITTENMNYAQWTRFLVQSGAVSDIECDVLYNEKEKFWLVVELPVAQIHISFVANKDLVEYDSIMRMLRIMIGSYIFLILVCTIIYSLIMASEFRKPFKKLGEFVKELEKGEYEKRLDLEGTVEIQELEQGINHLAEELENEKKLRKQEEDNRNQLIRDISHDLKNPLMTIRGYAELCMKKGQPQSDEYLEMILQNSIRANDLLMSLFEYSKLESADFQLQKEEADMSEFLRQEIIEWISELENRHFSYSVDISDSNMPVKIDILQMKRVFSNLFVNALKHNPEETEISLSLKERNGKYEIVFSDNGVGMSELYAKSIFNPFSRPDGKVRNSKDGGSGLGLAIVKKIIGLHGGEIEVDTAPDIGTTFKIQLPI